MTERGVLIANLWGSNGFDARYNTYALLLRDAGDVLGGLAAFEASMRCEPWTSYGASRAEFSCGLFDIIF